MGLLNSIKNIGSNPLAMASLGLLSAPRYTQNGVNPMEYAMQGMQAGIQNQQNQQQLAQNKQLHAIRLAEYGETMRTSNEKRQRQSQIRAYVEKSTDANLKNIYNVGGEEAAAKYLTERLKPKDPYKLNNTLVDRETLQPIYTAPPAEPSLISTYRLSNPGDKTLAGFDAWNRANKSSGAAQISLGKPMNITDLSHVRMPDGSRPPLGMSPEAALNAGAEVIPTEEQAAANKASTWAAMTKQQAVRTRDAIQRLAEFVQQQTPASMLDPAARGTYKSLANSAANEIAKSRGTPGAEPSVPGQNAALASVPTLEDITIGSFTKGDIVGGKLKALQNEFTDKDAVAPKKGGAWQTLPNGVRVREKQ